MKRYLFHFFLLITLLPISAFAQHDSLRIKIKNLAKLSKGTVEVAIKNLETGDTISFNGRVHAPMQSVFKFPIALTILDLVDKGKLSLEQKVHLSKNDVDTNTWSPLAKINRKRDTDISVESLVDYMVVESDNVACDALIRLSGGAAAVNQHIHDLGINGIQIKYTEAEMHENWKAQFSDWCEAIDMVELLEKFYTGKCLSKTSTDLLLSLMEKSKTGDKKINGLLPAGTIVAHKSGWSGSNGKGLTAASNDVGIITLPNGNHLLIAVFVTKSMGSTEEIEKTIAKIARTVYDEFTKN